MAGPAWHLGEAGRLAPVVRHFVEDIGFGHGGEGSVEGPLSTKARRVQLSGRSRYT